MRALRNQMAQLSLTEPSSPRKVEGGITAPNRRRRPSPVDKPRANRALVIRATTQRRKALLTTAALVAMPGAPSGTLRYDLDTSYASLLKLHPLVEHTLDWVNGGRAERHASNFWTGKHGEMYELRPSDPDFFDQPRSHRAIPISAPAVPSHDITATPQRRRIQQIVQRHPVGLQDPGSFSVESDAIKRLRDGVYVFQDDAHVSITRFYYARMAARDPFLVAPPGEPHALVRWSSTLPTTEGTVVPSVSTHTWSKWRWGRPHRLVIVPEPGTRLIPIDKHYRNTDFMEMVLMPGVMKLVRRLDDGSYLVHYSTPYALGFGKGPDKRTYVLMAKDVETARRELEANSVVVEGVIPAYKRE